MKNLKCFTAILLLGFILSFNVHCQVTTKPGSNAVTSITQSQGNNQGSYEVLSDLLVPITTIITLLSVSIGIWISLRQYRLKVKEEIRISKTAQSENDIKLLSLFSETIDIANGRKAHIISETVLEKLFEKGIISKEDLVI